MKQLFLALVTAVALLATPATAQTTERIIVIYGQSGLGGSDPNTTEVSRLLAKGWTVKHQSAAMAQRSWLIIFTLTPPTQETLALLDEKEAEAKRVKALKTDFEKKRAEWLAKQPKVEKP